MSLRLPKEYLSLSQVNAYLRCPRYYEFRYVQGIPEVPRAATYLGSAYHRTLQGYYSLALRGQRLGPDEVADLFGDVFNHGWVDNEGQEHDQQGVLWDEPRPAVYDTGIELSRLYVQRVGHATNPLEVEQRFQRTVDTPAGRLPVVGIVDLTTDQGRVVDHKTRARRLRQEDADKDLQPGFYALGLGGAVRFSFHTAIRTKTPVVEVVDTERTQQDIIITREVVASVGQAISAGSFPLNTTSWSCSRDHCPYWSRCVGRYK